MPDPPVIPEDVHVDMDELKALPPGSAQWLVTEQVAGKVKELQVSLRPFNAKRQVVLSPPSRLPRSVSTIEGPAIRVSRQGNFAEALRNEGQLPGSVMVQDEPTLMALDAISDDLGIQMLVSLRRYREFRER